MKRQARSKNNSAVKEGSAEDMSARQHCDKLRVELEAGAESKQSYLNICIFQCDNWTQMQISSTYSKWTSSAEKCTFLHRIYNLHIPAIWSEHGVGDLHAPSAAQGVRLGCCTPTQSGRTEGKRALKYKQQTSKKSYTR